MRYYETPVLTGTTEEKIRQIEEYLIRQTNDLNHNLENTTAEKFWQQTARALSSAAGEDAEAMSEENLRRSEYNALRALVIKSAAAVLKTEDTFSQTLQGAYLAESDYGAFMEEGFVNISGSPYSIAQLYKYHSKIISSVGEYKTELEGYITTGVLDKNTDTPVFGMDIGYNKNKFSFNGKEYTNESPSKIRITPTKISFYDGDYEAAYIQNKAIYFPNAHITANSGTIGGFCIAGPSNATNGFWDWSLSSVIRTDSSKVNASNPEFVVFLRGQGSGGSKGAYLPTNTVIGVKKRTSTDTSWNDASYTFYVRANGELIAKEADIEGTIKARKGYVGGFAITGASGGTFWPASLTSVIEPSDDSGKEYAVFLRGNYTYNGTTYGALTTDHNVFGIKKRAKSSDTWENDTSPYLFYVSLLGNIYGNTLTTEGKMTVGGSLSSGAITASGNITTSKNLIAESGYVNSQWLKANGTRIALGDTGVAATSGYSGNIEVLTAGDIIIGKYTSKASNITLLAKTLIRIGQHTAASSDTGTDSPPTDQILIQAKTSVTIGHASYKVGHVLIHATQFNVGQDAAPVDSAYIIASSSIRLGETGVTPNIYIRATNIYLKGITTINGTLKIGSKTVSINSSGTLVAS